MMWLASQLAITFNCTLRGNLLIVGRFRVLVALDHPMLCLTIGRAFHSQQICNSKSGLFGYWLEAGLYLKSDAMCLPALELSIHVFVWILMVVSVANKVTIINRSLRLAAYPPSSNLLELLVSGLQPLDAIYGMEPYKIRVIYWVYGTRSLQLYRTRVLDWIYGIRSPQLYRARSDQWDWSTWLYRMIRVRERSMNWHRLYRNKVTKSLIVRSVWPSINEENS